MKRFFRFLLVFLLVLGFSARVDAKCPPKRYVIVVSLDGFRWDYPQMYDCPNINAVAANGVSVAMWASYPASTFPNHWALATGLVPDHNGIVNNSFWAPDMQGFYSIGGPNKSVSGYFLGEPLWMTAEKQGVRAATIYWVGSDLADPDRHATYWHDYGVQPLLEYEARIDEALSLLEKPKQERPHLIMIYFDEPDHSGHSYGPRSEEVRAAVKRVDDMVGRLREGIAKSKYASQIDLIVLADHGMTDISYDRCVNPYDYIKKEWFDIIMMGTPTSIFTKPEYRDSVYNALKDVEHLSVWKKEEIPAELNYGTSERIGDIVVAPDLGWQCSERPRSYPGAHGYSPLEPDMQPIFRAEGPDFKKGYVGASFRNVSLYPLVCHLLGLQPAPNDGSLDEVKQLLK